MIYLVNPAPCVHEWEPEDGLLLEASKEDRHVRADAGKRSKAAHTSAREVRADRNRLDVESTRKLLARLQQMKRSIQKSLVDASDFKRFSAASLISHIDQEIAAAKAEIERLASLDYRTANVLGQAQVDQSVQAAQLTVIVSPALDDTLVRHAYENTVDLLSEPMQQFRNRVVTRVRRLSLAGTGFSDEMLGLARAIDSEGFANPDYSAERILRTELSRVFNASTYDRLEALAEKLPALRKIWIATKDDRTRETHRIAAGTYKRGSGIPIPDRFKVGACLLRFPSDPLATPSGKLAAGQTIMCRCNCAVDYDIAALADLTRSRVSLAMTA